MFWDRFSKQEEPATPLRHLHWSEGWLAILYHTPPAGALLELAHDRYGSGTAVGYISDLLPEVNAIGPYWRLTGIAKEAKESK